MGIIRMVFWIMLVPGVAVSQAPTKANLIVVPLKDTSFLFHKVSTILKENGYKIEKYSKSQNALITAPKVILEDVTMNLSISVEGNDLCLKGNTFIPNVGITPVLNLGSRGSPAEICWKELEKVAKQMGKKVIYKVD